MAKTRPQCRQYRLNPVSAVSPVASVYRSISMLRKNWVTRPTSAAQTKTSPTWEAMYGYRMNSPGGQPDAGGDDARADQPPVPRRRRPACP